MEIGDGVFFITKDWSVKYGKIRGINYYKDKKEEEVWYKLDTITSGGDLVECTSWDVFKSADEALAYLKRQKLIVNTRNETV